MARALPERVSYRVAEAVGGFVGRRSKRRATVARNMARITGEPLGSRRIEDLVDAAFRSYARYWFETFRLVREDRDFFLDRVVDRGFERLRDQIGRGGKGAIVVVGHLGNWDAAGAWVGAWGGRLVTVAEVLRPRRMFDFFRDHRAKLGMIIHAAEPGVTERLSAAVEDGALVAILGDRDLKGKGPEVTFFGERTTMPAGPASVAFRTGVPLQVAGVYGITHPDGRRGWEIVLGPPIELPDERNERTMAAVTQEMASHLEDFIRKHPEEWHVLQPLWSSDRDARKPSAR